MLKKIYLWLIIIFVSYILLIFLVPSVTTIIDRLIWINWFTENVRKIKSVIDDSYENLPSKEEVVDKYNKAYSWAVEIKENVEEWIEFTKDKIDTAREVLSWAEDTYNKAKDTYDDAIEFIDKANDKISETKEKVDKINETAKDISELFSTWALNNTWILNNQ